MKCSEKIYFCETTNFTYCNDTDCPLEALQQLFGLNLHTSDSCSPKGSFAPSFPSGQLPLSFSLLHCLSLSPSFTVSLILQKLKLVPDLIHLLTRHSTFGRSTFSTLRLCQKEREKNIKEKMQPHRT